MAADYQSEDPRRSLSRVRLRRTDLALTIIGWTAVALFLLITVLPGLVGGRVFLGTDALSSFAPWKAGSAQGAPVNVGVGDTLDQYAPWSSLIVDLTNDGSFPQWDPYNGGGGELGALPNTGIFSPLSLPWWLLPAHLAPAGTKVLEVVAIALGMYLLLRKQWSLPAFTVPLAAILFATSGFMIAWTNWPQTRVAAMIPLLFWVTDRLATRHRWGDAVWMGLVVASMLLGGFPSVLAYSLYSAVAFFVVRVAATHTPLKNALMSLVRSACGVLLGVALAAFQIFPFIWFSTHYVDFEARQGFRGGHLPFEVLSTSIVPHLLGLPNGLNPNWPIHFIEGFSYIGACALVLIVFACLIRPRVRFAPGVLPFFTALLIVLAVATYWGGPVLAAIQTLPAMGTSPIGRIRSVMGFAAAILAALGASAIYSPTPLRRQFNPKQAHATRAQLGNMLRLFVACLICVPVLVAVKQSINPGALLYSQLWVAIAALLMAVPAVAIFFTWLTPSRSSAFLATLLVFGAVTVPAVDVAQKWWPLSDSESFYPFTATHQFLSENLGEDRYASVGQAMLPGSSPYYRQRSATGHAFAAQTWKELMLTTDDETYKTPTYSTLSLENLESSVESPVLDRLAVKYLVLAPEDDASGLVSDSVSVAHRGDATVLQRNNALDRIRWANSSVVESDADARLQLLSSTEIPASTVVLEDPLDEHPDTDSAAQITVQNTDTNTVSATVTSTGPGWVVIADPLRGGGWSASLDGEPTQLVDVDHALVAVWVPESGTHQIDIRFDPPMFKVGLVVSLVSLTGVMGVGVYWVVSSLVSRRRRKPSGVVLPVNSPGDSEADGDLSEPSIR